MVLNIFLQKKNSIITELNAIWMRLKWVIILYAKKLGLPLH